MIYRELYNRFSPEFLRQHHDVVIQDVFHHVQAYLLFSTECRCKENCRCEHFQQKAILSMSMAYYHKAQKEQASTEKLEAIKIIFNLPDTAYFADTYEDGYPLWLIQDELEERIKDNSIKIVDRLGWTMLKMSKAYYEKWRERRASLTEALRLILGEKPLKSGDKEKIYLAGAKNLSKTFGQYKSASHFIMALQYMRRGESVLAEEEVNDENVSITIDTPAQIERFLSLSLWFRQELRLLIRPNVKIPELFQESELVSLPDWICYAGIDIHIKPHQIKLQELESGAEFVDTSELWQKWDAMQLLKQQTSVG
ncbi:MAG: hypothetical protein KBB83_02090 [Alphaproteobacteria bacterium]|nr:hypothetical protein [Alphaproteobacteria bacterium]